MLKKLLIVALFVTFASVASAATFNVSNPAEFQTALTTAQGNGQDDVINVAAGTYTIASTLTYTASTPSEDFTLEILGAGSDLVFLDGQSARSILRIDTTAVVDDDNLGIRITNMTFINGNAVGDPSDGGALAITLDDEGGTGSNSGSNGADFVEVSGCEFYENAADDDGGAIAFKGDVSEFLSTEINEGVQFIDLTIEDNVARGIGGDAPLGAGGGIFVEGGIGTIFSFTDVEFINNRALSEGGGVSVGGAIGVSAGIAVFENFGFFGNQITGAGGRGGGAFVAAIDLNLNRGGFVDNTASEGGGVYLAQSTRMLSENVGYVANQASVIGGGIATNAAAGSGIALINNTFTENGAGTGGGVYIARDLPGEVWLYNNIIYGNFAEQTQGQDVYIDDDPDNNGAVLIVQLYNNDLTSYATTCMLDSACTENSLSNSVANIDADPLFVDITARPIPDIHLLPNSPAIDAGTNTVPVYGFPTEDIEGDPRPTDGDGDTAAIVDIGADETAAGGTLPSADLGVTWTYDPAPATGGENVTMSITVTNGGPDEATGVTLLASLNEESDLVSAVFNQGNPCTSEPITTPNQPFGTLVTCELGVVAADNSVPGTIVITTPVVEVTRSIITSTSVSGNEDDFGPTPNFDDRVITLIAAEGPPMADLSITKMDAPDPVFSGGQDLTYTVTVENNGPDPATGVTLSDTLPAGVTFQSASATAGQCDTTPDTGGVLNCSLDDLAVTSNTRVTIVVTPDIVTEPVTITNSASVTATEEDPDATNNTAAEDTVVNPPSSDIGLAISATPESPLINEQITYSVTVSNSGPSNNAGIVATVVLPPMTTFVTVSIDQGSCVEADGILTCTIGVLAAGASVTAQVIVTAPGTAMLVTMSATVVADVEDPTPTNNSISEDVTVIDVIDLVIQGTSKGGGSVGWIELLFLLTVVGVMTARAGWTQLRSGSRVLLPALLCMMSAIMLMSANEVKAQENWYVGVTAGTTSLDYSEADLTADLASLGWTINNPKVDDSNNTWKIYAGFQVNDWFAVEAGYVDLGEVITQFGATIPPTQIDALLSDTFSVHPYQGDGWMVAGVARYAFVPDQFSVVGRAGLFAWESKTRVRVISGGTGSVAGNDSGTDAMFGVGVEWQINEQWALTADWERYKLNEWLDVPSIGVRYSF